MEAAVNGDGRVVLAIQRDAERDEVGLEDVHPIAVVAQVGAFRRLPTGGAHALVEGRERVRLTGFDASGDAWRATVSSVEPDVPEGTEIDALAGSVKNLFAEYVGAGAAVAAELAMAMARANEPDAAATGRLRARFGSEYGSAPAAVHETVTSPPMCQVVCGATWTTGWAVVRTLIGGLNMGSKPGKSPSSLTRPWSVGFAGAVRVTLSTFPGKSLPSSGKVWAPSVEKRRR